RLCRALERCPRRGRPPHAARPQPVGRADRARQRSAGESDQRKDWRRERAGRRDRRHPAPLPANAVAASQPWWAPTDSELSVAQAWPVRKASVSPDRPTPASLGPLLKKRSFFAVVSPDAETMRARGLGVALARILWAAGRTMPVKCVGDA